MIDSINDECSTCIYDNKRQALIEKGVIGYWADLGETETKGDVRIMELKWQGELERVISHVEARALASNIAYILHA